MPNSGKVKKSKSPPEEEKEEETKMKFEENKILSIQQPEEFSLAFGVRDDLHLQLEKDLQASPVTVPLAQQIPQETKDQIRGLKDENGRLFRLLKEKDFEIRQLKKIKAEHSASLNIPGLTNETAATKIVEISKKLRETVAEMEGEKTKSKLLAKKYEELKLQISDPKDLNIGQQLKLKENCEEKKSEEELKNLQEKLKQSESKVADWRNQFQIMKQELKLANRVISQEVGENFNLHSILSGKSTWKGRMQQIITLQQKVSELKQQVEDLQSRNGNYPSETMPTEHYGSNPSLRRIIQERKDAQEKIITEHKEFQEQLSAMKTKYESVKARNQVLSNESKVQKQQIQTLLDKGQHDDEMITTLMGQLSQMKDLMHENLELKQENVQQKKFQEVSAARQNDEYIVEQLNRIIAERDEKIKSLSESLKLMSGETTTKREMFCLTPLDLSNQENENSTDSIIQEHIFCSNNDPLFPQETNPAERHAEHPQMLNSSLDEINLNSRQGDCSNANTGCRSSFCRIKKDGIQKEHHLTKCRLLENTISHQDNNSTMINEIKSLNKSQTNSKDDRSTLSMDPNIIDEDELKTVLEIEEDKKEAVKKDIKVRTKKTK